MPRPGLSGDGEAGRHTHGGWPVSDLAPVLMAADIRADLTRRESWTLASELVIGDHVGEVDWLASPLADWPSTPDALHDKRSMLLSAG